MSTVERRFDAETGRWLVRDVDRPATSPFDEVSPGVWVATDADGRAAECLIAAETAARVPAEIRSMIETDLAWIPGVDGGSESSVDGGNNGTGTSLATINPGASDVPTTVIHEPGIPYADGDGAVLVPTEGGTVRVRMSDSVLMIDVPVQSSHEWVRISDADTGSVLALGRVQKFGDGFGANVTFALDGSDIHIALTDCPLDPVADRRTRRSLWLDDVLTNLRHSWWRHPWRTRDTARDAMAVARSIGDIAREARARRYVRFVPAGLGVAVGAAMGAVGITVATLAPGSPAGLAVVGTTSAVYGFGGTGSVTVSAGVNSDGTIGLVMSDTLVGRRMFSAGTATTGDPDPQRRACLESKNTWTDEESMPAVTARYVVSLRADGAGSVLLGTVEMSSEAPAFSSVDDSCRTAPAAPDGSITAEVVYQRSTEEFTLPAPTGPLGGRDTWTLAIEKVAPQTGALDGTSRDPVTFRTDG